MCAFKIRQFPKVSPEDADTYKCFATNEYGKAVCTVLLNVIEGKILLSPSFDYKFGFFFCYIIIITQCVFTVGFSRTKELQKTQGGEGEYLMLFFSLQCY